MVRCTEGQRHCSGSRSLPLCCSVQSISGWGNASWAEASLLQDTVRRTPGPSFARSPAISVCLASPSLYHAVTRLHASMPVAGDVRHRHAISVSITACCSALRDYYKGHLCKQHEHLLLPCITSEWGPSAVGRPSACVVISGRSKIPGDATLTSFVGTAGDSDIPTVLGTSAHSSHWWMEDAWLQGIGSTTNPPWFVFKART